MNKNQNTCDPAVCFLCGNCMPQWIPSIETYKKTIQVKKGEKLFSEREPVKGIYFLKKGSFKIHMNWEAGKQMIIRFARQGDLIGHRGLGDETRYPVSATAIENATVCFIEKDFFQQTLAVNPAFTYKLITFYSNELQDAEKRIRNLALMDVKGRIADTILMLSRVFGQNDEGYINITITRQDMATYAGTIYETFFKISNEFVKQKIIRYSGKNVKILKHARLQEYAKQVV